MEKDSQFIDVFHSFLSRHIVDDGFTHRRKVGPCDHVMKLTGHAPGEHTVFSEEGVVFFGSIDLQLYQHLDEIRVARSLRPAEDQLEFVEMIVHERNKLMQVLGGKCKAVFCFSLWHEIEISVLCRLEAGEQFACGLAHKVFKQSGLIRVVAVECTLREACLRDNLVQRCVLEALLQKFFFPNLKDLYLSLCTFHWRPPDIPVVYTAGIL